MKTCTKCNNTYPEEKFAFKNKSLGKRNARCDECRRADNRQSYYNHHQKSLDRITQYKKSNRKWYSEFKKTLSCSVCGESEEACLDFHHIDESEKDFTISMNTNSSVKKLKEEISKCACLCANCHRKLHAGKINPPLVKLDII